MSGPARAPGRPAPGVTELELLLAVAAIVVVGPFAVVAGAVLAIFATSWRRGWLALLSLPSAAGAFVLWPLAHGQLLATATALHRSHGGTEQVMRHLWPHLWPVWLCSLALTPLIAFAIVLRGSARQLDHTRRSAASACGDGSSGAKVQATGRQ